MKIRILSAYCVQLGHEVSIDQARLEYLSEDHPSRYHFYCSSPDCFANKVRVIGVNYHYSAEESKKYKIPHFRKQDEHLPNCAWVIDTLKENQQGRLPNETEEEAKLRQIRQKLSDLIDVFDPTEDSDDIKNEDSFISSTPRFPEQQNTILNNNTKNESSKSGCRRTNQLSRLIETWREAKNKLPKKEFEQLKLNVVGIGKLKLCNYFKRFNYAWNTEHFGVMYGGVKPDFKRYGLDFRMTFYDKINDCDVILYISKEKMEKYRYRRYFDMELSRDDIRYITVYFIPDKIELYENGKGYKSYQIEINQLKNFFLIVEPKT